jgi:hypothetical protein
MDDTTLNQIADYVTETTSINPDPLHRNDHAERVRLNSLKLIKILKLEDKIDKNLLQAICLLHDVPQSVFKKYPLGFIGKHISEKLIIKKNLPAILNRFNLGEEVKKVMYNAIYHHPGSIPYMVLNKNADYYTKILQDSDSLDYFSMERLNMLMHSKDNGIFYKIGSMIAHPYFKYGRANIKKFLNYTESAQALN